MANNHGVHTVLDPLNDPLTVVLVDERGKCLEGSARIRLQSQGVIPGLSGPAVWPCFMILPSAVDQTSSTTCSVACLLSCTDLLETAYARISSMALKPQSWCLRCAYNPTAMTR